MRFIICLGLIVLTTWAQDDAGLKSRIAGRAARVRQLVEDGAATESKGGLLRAESSASAADKQVINTENDDRQAVWELVAHRTRTTVDEVKDRFAARSFRSHPMTPKMRGSCKLAPAKAPDVARLLQYLKQGMNYASQKKFDLALAEFQPALAIDPTFLALNQNVGAAQMGIKKYAAAQTAFHAELKLVDCLAGLNDSQLADFGYFVEVAEQDPVKRRQALSEKLKEVLPKARAAAHYNLACAHALQGQPSVAMTELRAALDAGFSNKQALNQDPDLNALRQLPEFRELLGSVK